MRNKTLESRRIVLIINEKEVLQGMKDKEKRISLPVNIKEPLRKAQLLFDELNHANEDESLLTALTETEGKMNRILLEALQSHPLVDLKKYDYDNVIEDSIRYLFVPKGYQVEHYVVDVIMVFFKCKGENSEISVNLPLYLITEQDEESIIVIEPEEDNGSIESLTIFN